MTQTATQNDTKNSSTLRDVYAHKALEQIPRILSNQDRTPTSPT